MDSLEPASRAIAPDIPDNSKSDSANLGKNKEIFKGLSEIYDNLGEGATFSPKEFVGQIAIRLGIKNVSSDRSNYVELNLGGNNSRSTIRISGHYANSLYFTLRGNKSESNYGIVVKTTNARFRPDPKVNYLEFVYYGDRVENNAELQKAITAGIRTIITTGSIKNMPEPDRINPSGKFTPIVNVLKQKGFNPKIIHDSEGVEKSYEPGKYLLSESKKVDEKAAAAQQADDTGNPTDIGKFSLNVGEGEDDAPMGEKEKNGGDNLGREVADRYLQSRGQQPRFSVGPSDLAGETEEYRHRPGMAEARDEREGVDYFPTPDFVAKAMVQLADVRDGDTALEPSAGRGAIARHFGPNTRLTAIEPSDVLRTDLQRNIGGNNRDVRGGVFEDYDGKHSIIVQNAPFGKGGRTAIAHTRKAYFDNLEDGGRLVSLLPAGPEGQRRFADLAREIKEDGGHITAIVKLSDNTFRKNGARIPVNIVVIDKVDSGLPTKEVDLTGSRAIRDLGKALESFEIPDRDEVAGANTETSSTADYADGTPRFSVVNDPELIGKLDKEKHVRAYRSVQIDEDGTIYSPMAASMQEVKGGAKTRVPNPAAQMQQWDQSVEHPEMVDEDGHVKINSKDSNDPNVAYNPYDHSCVNSLINDQFTSAWRRDQLYTMEVMVPESELTSKYHADRAKNTTGIHMWKTGPVGRQLPLEKRRLIMLSRWMKNVRVVPWEEVAQNWVDTLKGENIDVPFNCVPRAILNMLTEGGVRIVEPVDSAGKDCMDAYNAWKADPVGYVGDSYKLPEHVKRLNENTATDAYDYKGDMAKIWEESQKEEKDYQAMMRRRKEERKKAAAPSSNGLKVKSKKEFAKLSNSIFTNGPKEPKEGVYYDAFTDKNYYIYTSNEYGSFQVKAAMRIEGNEDIISAFQKKIQDGTFRTTDNFNRSIEKARSDRESDSHNRPSDSGRRASNEGSAFVGLGQSGNTQGRDGQVGEGLPDSTPGESRPAGGVTGPTDIGKFSLQEGEDDAPMGEKEKSEVMKAIFDFNAGPKSLADSIAYGLVAVAKSNRGNVALRVEAMRAIGGNLSKLRQAMSRQRAYDRKTVNDIVRLARTMMTATGSTGFTRGEVRQLMGLIGKANGGTDTVADAAKVVDVLLDHHLRQCKDMMHKLLKVKGTKVNPSGVVTQAGLDIKGQRMVDPAA